MNKLIKVSLCAIAFMFVAGCASQKPVSHGTPVAKEKVKHHRHHPSKHCKGKKCYDKFGSAKHESAK
jgi:hypothetical protein